MLDSKNPYARRYASLAVTDLLDAREAVHVHFMQMENVIATAIGLYRIRKGDLDYSHYHPAGEAALKERGKKAVPRSMENTVVQPWSWPCVLVFVKHWLKPNDYHAAALRGQVVPPFIDLPDGRVIPTCVIQAGLWEGVDTRLVGYQFTKRLMGGGYPAITRVQGQEHVGSIGCLVTDGVRHFALTNQHVAGEAGSEIFTLLQGDGQKIGTSAKRSLRSEPFQKLYPGFPGASTRSNLDIGLVDVDDLSGWTAQIFGLGVLGPLVEFNVHTASLDWIGTAATGPFDEGVYPAYFEDDDYLYRMKLAGFSRVTETAALCYHFGCRTQFGTVGGSAWARGAFLRSRDYYICKWGGPPGSEKYVTPFGGRDVGGTPQ